MSGNLGGQIVVRWRRAVPTADDDVAEQLVVADAPLDEMVLPGLVNACVKAYHPFVLVLDDLHLVQQRRCLEAIGYLAQRLPRRCQLALATRTDPHLVPLCVKGAVSSPWSVRRRLSPSRSFVRWGA